MARTRHRDGSGAAAATTGRASKEKNPALEHDETLGAVILSGTTCRFRVWAPSRSAVNVHLLGTNRIVPMHQTGRGYHEVNVEHVHPGDLYLYQLAPDIERADPASRFQPKGVHGPSQVVACKVRWDEKGWSGRPLKDYIIYEIHVGTFTPTGTFNAIIPYIEYIVQLGVTAIELMPVAQFPGARNWGYDGVFPFAAQTPTADRRA